MPTPLLLLLLLLPVAAQPPRAQPAPPLPYSWSRDLARSRGPPAATGETPPGAPSATEALFAAQGGAALHLGSKTPYLAPELAPERLECPVVHVNMLLRHGSRHITKNKKPWRAVQYLTDFERRGELSTLGHVVLSDVAAFARREEPLLGQLAAAGAAEHAGIAGRVAALLPERGGRYVFSSSAKARAVDSMRAFRDALPLPPGASAHTQPPADCAAGAAHSLLRFHDDCPAYRHFKASGSGPWERAHVAPARERLQAPVRKALAQLLAPEAAERMPVDDAWALAEALYAVCQIQLGALAGAAADGACAALDAEATAALELVDDAEAFHEKALPGGLPERIACTLLADVANATRMAAGLGAAHVGGHFRFAHAETLLPLLALMGLAPRDDPLSPPPPGASGRAFRTAALVPMAANVALVLSDCGSGDLQVQALLNERPVQLPGCPDDGPCDLEAALAPMERHACSAELWERLCDGRFVCSASGQPEHVRPWLAAAEEGGRGGQGWGRDEL